MQMYSSQNIYPINYTGKNVSTLKNTTKAIYKKFNRDLYFDFIPKAAIPKKLFNVNKPHIFKYEYSYYNTYTIEFNPNNIGQLKDKKNKKPIDVYIIKINESTAPNIDSYHFVDKDLQQEYGYVSLKKQEDGIVVNWLENKCEEKISGVGKLADKLEVRYCEENNLPYNIFSFTTPSAIIAHYKRGKRFKRPKNGSEEKDFLKTNYGTSSLNKIIKTILKEAEEKNQPVDLSAFNDYMFGLYMPKSLIRKYATKHS